MPRPHVCRARRAFLAAATIVALSLCASSRDARADDASVAAATVLFDEAIALMDAGSYLEACPKLARSQALAPSGGTLLALGECNERLGRTASAWVAYREAATRAASAGKRDAEAAALQRARHLEPNLPRLTVIVPWGSQVDGLEVRRDGEVLKHAELGVAIPVNPGKHDLRASAPGVRSWTMTVEARPGVATEVSVPALVPGDDAVEPDAPGTVEDRRPGRAPGDDQRVIGLFVMGASAVTLVAGGVMGLVARGQNEDALENCSTATRCNARGLELTGDAQQSALTSTILFIGGAVGLAGGALVYFTAPRGGPGIAVTPAVGATSAGASATVVW